MWWAQTTHPSPPIDSIEKTIPNSPNNLNLPVLNKIEWDITPKAGKIKIYTSGCPKNQNKCWNKIGSPPPEGSKNEELKFRSARSIVIPPANTGKANNNKKTVTRTLHINKEKTSKDICPLRPTNIVTKKFSELKTEETPAKCKEKIIKSKEILNIFIDRGGYKVQPPLGPPETNKLSNKKKIAGNINQTLKLFKRGKHKSKIAPKSGISQLPNAPIKIGITVKKNH